MRAESAGCHSAAELRARPSNRMVEQCAAVLRGGRARKARTHALCRVGRQRELRHQQQAAPGVDEAEVHAASRVFENPVAQDPIDQAIGLRLRVRRLDGEEYQEACADPADHGSVGLDLAMSDALQKGDHVGMMRI